VHRVGFSSRDYKLYYIYLDYSSAPLVSSILFRVQLVIYFRRIIQVTHTQMRK